jgi:hypothetical protein
VSSIRTVQRACSEDQDASITLVWKRMCRSMPNSAAVSRRYARIFAPPAIASSSFQGLNS